MFYFMYILQIHWAALFQCYGDGFCLSYLNLSVRMVQFMLVKMNITYLWYNFMSSITL